MTKVKALITGFLLCATGFSFAQSTERLSGQVTLQQCIETAIRNNLQVRQAAYQAQADQVTYQQAKGNQLPFISGNISHGINQGRSIDPYTNSYADQQVNFANYSINTSITLWNGSSIQNNIRQNAFNAKASELDWQQAKDNITINVILAYLQVLNNQEQLEIARKQVDVTKNQADRLETLNKNGAIAPATFYDMKGLLGSDELNLISVRNNLENSKLALAQLMNVNYAKDATFESIGTQVNPVLYDGNPDVIYDAATTQLALVKAADLRVKSAAKRVLSAKGQKLPVLSLNGGLGTNYSSVAYRQILLSTADVSTNRYVMSNNTKLPVFEPQNTYNTQKISYGDQWRNNFNSSISIGLQFPILNGLQAKSRVRQAEIAEKRTNFETQTVKTQLRQSVDQAYINMNTAFERYNTLSKQVQDFTESFKAAEVRFNEGVSTSVDYLVAKNNVDKSNSNFISAKYDYLLRVKILDFYQGKPLW